MIRRKCYEELGKRCKPNMEARRPYLNIVRGILRKQGYQIFSKDFANKNTIYNNNAKLSNYIKDILLIYISNEYKRFNGKI